MKKYFYLFIFFFGAVSGKAQIVNNQFENWTNVGAYDSLNFWSTDAYLSPTAAQKETSSPQSGSTSLKLVTTSYTIGLPLALPGAASTGGFILAGTSLDLAQGGQPDNVRHASLKGYYKYAPIAGAQGSIEVVLYKRNGSNRDTIASGIMPLTSAVSSYTLFNVPLVYKSAGDPDSSVVYFQSSTRAIPDVFTNTATIGSALYVDSVFFDGVQAVDELPANLVSVKAYPNPASDFLTIESKWKTQVKVSVSVLDVNGKLVQSTPLQDNKQRIDISSLSNGNYFYQLNDEKGAKLYSGKFSVSH